MESIEPYDFSGGGGLRTAYLAGYLADKYDVTAEASIDRANERVKRSTEDSFAGTVQGMPRSQRKTAACSSAAAKHVMRCIPYGCSTQHGTETNTPLP